MRPHPSRLSVSGGSCVEVGIIFIIGVFCWPLLIPAVVLITLFSGSGISLYEWLLKLAIGIIAVFSPFAALFTIILPSIAPISEYWIFWIVTIGEAGYGYWWYEKKKKKDTMDKEA